MSAQKNLYLFLLPLLACSVGGCGSVLSTWDEVPPLKPDMAQIIIVRVGNSWPSSAASLEVNDEQVATLSPSERYVADVFIGKIKISVFSASIFSAGKYTIEFPAEKGKVYRLRISDRGDNLAGPIPLGAILHENAGAFRIGS